MTPICDWHCWEIMECNNPQECLAWNHPEIPCWKIIKQLNDHRNAFNICQDCIVHILKSENSVLSEFAILKISETKVYHSMVMLTRRGATKGQHCNKTSALSSNSHF
jgi:hypothetical protein